MDSSPWYESFGTIVGALASVWAVGGVGLLLWRRTLGRRRRFTRALRRLGTNAQFDYFASQLESPPAIREAHPEFARLVWVDRDFVVCAIVNPHGAVDGYSISSRRPRFRPSFSLPASGLRERRWIGRVLDHLPDRYRSLFFRFHYPPGRIRLCASRFSSVSDEPIHVAAWVGARSFQYEETHYYGNPGNYLNFVFASTDVGPADGLEAGILFGPDSPHEYELTWEAPLDESGCLDDVPKMGKYRYHARINTVALVTWEPSDDRSGLIFVRRDEIRTFA